MYKVDNYDEKPFDHLLDFLDQKDISISEYQAYEYFVRDALDKFSSATSFPDEVFTVRVTASSLQALWEKFKNDYGGRVVWGLHPLANNSPDFRSQLKQFENQLSELVSSIPSGNEFQELVLFRRNVKKDVEAINRKLENLQLMAERSKFYRDQETAYLSISKFFAKKAFEKYGIGKKIDDFICIKYKCYFQDSFIPEKGAIVTRLIRFAEDHSLVSFLEGHWDSNNCEKVMNEFEKMRTDGFSASHRFRSRRGKR